MRVSIREAELSDAAAVTEVVRLSILELCAADHQNHPETLSDWLVNKTPRKFLDWISDADNYCVVTEVDHAVSGVGLLHRDGEIKLFYVVPGAERRGLGRLIHDSLETRAKAWGLDTLRLESTDLARTFYEMLGYRPAGPPVPRFGVLSCFPYEKTLSVGMADDARSRNLAESG